MEALEALLHRVSVPRVGGSVPPPEVLANIFRAALRVPDHAQLRPWRFLLIRGGDRAELGELFVKVALAANPDLTESDLIKVKSKPLRAPLIVVVVAIIRPHPKVPAIEQMLSAGAAAQNMLLAAHALGIGAMWRTGNMAYHKEVLCGLGLARHERLIGYLYLGEIQGKTRTPPALDVEAYFVPWPAKQ